MIFRPVRFVTGWPSCFRHTISCYYLLNYTKTMAFRASPRSTNPVADPGVGHLVVQIRLSQGKMSLSVTVPNQPCQTAWVTSSKLNYIS